MNEPTPAPAPDRIRGRWTVRPDGSIEEKAPDTTWRDRAQQERERERQERRFR